ncbi:hypothetical protein PIROE2DRAFT_66822 [Piromyces sp. E2]|nr:hypothetical protein PIROE2DRAFT_66822 [Piromyces sp. E2]|eukprot:OUM69421.1 hypothetical protein PIROE2DRAFT_66822 [Piromyces sp. E2]
MDDIFNINNSESENEDYSDEEESKITLLKSKKSNDNSDESESENEFEDENEDNEEKDNNESDEKDNEKDLNINDSRFDMSGFDDDDGKDDNDSNENENMTEITDKKQKRTGVVYLSKIPPFMKPIKIRHLLSRYAKIGRIYLAAEDDKIAHRRKKYGGNRKRNYTEGWVEFLDKREAKLVVNHLNNHIIGGKKSSWYHDDIWNMKYLHGFKWIHLTERIAYEKAVRNQKLKAEMAQASRESNVILRNVEKAKMIESMEKRKLEKLNEDDNSAPNQKKAKISDSSPSNDTDSFQNPETLKIIRKYKQRKPVNPEKKTAVINPKQKSVLSKIFN